MAVVEMSASDKKLRRLWRALPADRAVSEQEAFELLEQEANRPGDGAWASAMIVTLRGVGALVPGGAIRRSETFPDLPPDNHNLPGSDAFNRRLEEVQAEERRRRDLRDAEAQRAWENGPAGRERRELLALIDERVDERVDERLRALLREMDHEERERVWQGLRTARRTETAA